MAEFTVIPERPAAALRAARTVLPHCGLEMSRLGLGLAHLHLLPAATRRDLIDRAIDLGITHLDTARFYGDGLSEATLGAVLGARRAKVTIASKFGLLPTPLIGAAGAAAPSLRKVRSLLRKLRLVNYPRRSYSAQTFRESLEQSLRLLRTDVIDIYHLHEPPAGLQLEEELLAAFEQAKKAGRVRFIGISGAAIDGVVDRHPGVFDVLQSAEGQWDPARHVPDLTHSLLSGAVRRHGALAADEVRDRLRRALMRRPDGAVVLQTRRPDRLEQLVVMADGC